MIIMIPGQVINANRVLNRLNSGIYRSKDDQVCGRK